MAGHKNSAENKRRWAQGKQPRRHKDFQKDDPMQAEIAREGGNAAHEAKQTRTTIRECLEALRTRSVKINGQDVPLAMAVAMKLYAGALDGDVKSTELLMKGMGELEEQLSVKEIPRLIDDIPDPEQA